MMLFLNNKINWKINRKRLVIIIFIVFLTAGVTNGIIWYLLNDTVRRQNETINSLHTEINKLNKQLKNIK